MHFCIDSRPGVIVIVIVMITIVQVIDGTECNVIVIESRVIVIVSVTLLLQLNISITPKFNFIENNQTKKSSILTYWDLDKHHVQSFTCSFIYLFISQQW